jgi:hypothetical protein
VSTPPKTRRQKTKAKLDPKLGGGACCTVCAPQKYLEIKSTPCKETPFFTVYDNRGDNEMKPEQSVQLKGLREQFGDFIVRLALREFESGVGRAFDNKLQQSLAGVQREVIRRINKADATPQHLMDLRVTTMMFLRLGDLYQRHAANQKAKGFKRKRAEREVSWLLNVSMVLLSSATEELAQRLPFEPMGNLAKRFYFTFYNVTRAECEADAEAVQAGIDRTVASGVTIDDLKARIAAPVERQRATA